MEAIIFIGIQASGKSSFYKKYFSDTHIRINLDMLKTRYREQKFFNLCLETGQSLVVDNTNPTAADRERYITPAKLFHAKVIGYYFQSSIELCMKRNEGRTGKGKVPAHALRSTHSKLVLPHYQEGFDALFYVCLTQEGEFLVKEWNNEI